MIFKVIDKSSPSKYPTFGDISYGDLFASKGEIYISVEDGDYGICLRNGQRKDFETDDIVQLVQITKNIVCTIVD